LQRTEIVQDAGGKGKREKKEQKKKKKKTQEMGRARVSSQVGKSLEPHEVTDKRHFTSDSETDCKNIRNWFQVPMTVETVTAQPPK
jgi:hypothetical protein